MQEKKHSIGHKDLRLGQPNLGIHIQEFRLDLTQNASVSSARKDCDADKE